MTTERTPQDVLREDEVMARLSAENPKSRQHREERSDGWSSWRCVPIRDVVELRALILAALDKAIAEAPDSPPFAGHIGPEPWPELLNPAPDSLSGLGSAAAEPAFHFRGAMSKPLYHGPWCVHGGHGESDEPFIHDDACRDSRVEASAPDTLSEKPGLPDLDWLMRAVVARFSDSEYHRAKDIILRIAGFPTARALKERVKSASTDSEAR